MTTEPVPQRMSGLSVDGGETYIAFDLDTVTDDEAIALEDVFRMPWLQFLTGLQEGRIKSQKALVWLAQRRDNPDITAESVTYEIRNFTMRMEDAPDPLPEAEVSSEPVTWEPSLNASASEPGNGDGSHLETSTDTSTISIK